MPVTPSGKAIASRNATTHGVFARDIVLPALGEDPGGYRAVQDELVQQLRPGNLLERHYVEKIAAASWRLRQLHRWQAQLFEDAALSEDQRLDKLDKVLRHETALQRQIDTAVRMLAKDVPSLYARRIREQVLEDTQISERECRDDPEDDRSVAMEIRNRQYQLRKATNQAANELSVAPLDAADAQICQNEPLPGTRSSPASLPFPNRGGSEEQIRSNAEGIAGGVLEICQNELPAVPKRTYRTYVRTGISVRGNLVAPELGATGFPSQPREAVLPGVYAQ